MPDKFHFKTEDAEEFETDERCHIRELINDAKHANVSIAQARVEAGVSTKLHSLDGDELYYILRGQGVAEIAGRRYQVSPGDVVLIKTGIPQRITNTGDDDLVFLCVCDPRYEDARYNDLEP